VRRGLFNSSSFREEGRRPRQIVAATGSARARLSSPPNRYELEEVRGKSEDVGAIED
jgi:hypothetical protein